MPTFIALLTLTFLVALIYSSVGHGGASGYIAVLTLFSFPHPSIAISALCLNLFVAGIAFYAFFKAHYFSWRLTWPFAVASIPAAFLGGLIKVPTSLYAALLAFVLVCAGFRLLLNLKKVNDHEIHQKPSLTISLILGAFVGILSGIVGVGGGIFLSPILILCRWADTKTTAATSAFFILVNSMAALSGKMIQGNHSFSPFLFSLIAVAFFGGMVGSELGAVRFPSHWLKRVLAFVLFLAAFKLTIH